MRRRVYSAAARAIHDNGMDAVFHAVVVDSAETCLEGATESQHPSGRDCVCGSLPPLTPASEHDKLVQISVVILVAHRSRV